MRKHSKKSQRQERILSALQEGPALRVGELASDLGVSSETIRRDLSELVRGGRVKRTYGGAVRSRAFEPDLEIRVGLHVEQRRRIARKAVELLGGSEALFIGGGATTLHFARALKESAGRMFVITPSFSIAHELASNSLIKVTALPGLYERKESLVYGAETVSAIEKLRPPAAVLGASGVGERGVSEALMTAAQVYEAMIGNAEKSCFLADSSKFGKRSLQLIADWRPGRTLISEAPPPASLLAAIEEGGARFVAAEG